MKKVFTIWDGPPLSVERRTCIASIRALFPDLHIFDKYDCFAFARYFGLDLTKGYNIINISDYARAAYLAIYDQSVYFDTDIFLEKSFSFDFKYPAIGWNNDAPECFFLYNADCQNIFSDLLEHCKDLVPGSLLSGAFRYFMQKNDHLQIIKNGYTHYALSAKQGYKNL